MGSFEESLICHHPSFIGMDHEVLNFICNGTLQEDPLDFSILLKAVEAVLRGDDGDRILTLLREKGLRRQDHWFFYLYGLVLCLENPIAVGFSMKEDDKEKDKRCPYCNWRLKPPKRLSTHVDSCADAMAPWMKLAIAHSFKTFINDPSSIEGVALEYSFAIR